MNAEAGNSLGEESSFEETNTCVPDKVAEPERAGITTMAGSAGLTVQQSLWMVALGSDIEAQQSCPSLCARCRQIAAGAAKIPINRVATAARWKTPCNMVSAYYAGWISR